MSEPFIILTLPRSRSAWLAHFLSYPPATCGHDVAVSCESISDFLCQFDCGMSGTVETGAVVAWRLIRHRLPKAKIVTIRRPIGEVRTSLAKLGIYPVEGELESRSAMLDMLSVEPSVHSLDFRDLDDPDCCGRLFEHCLEMEFDHQWWA